MHLKKAIFTYYQMNPKDLMEAQQAEISFSRTIINCLAHDFWQQAEADRNIPPELPKATHSLSPYSLEVPLYAAFKSQSQNW